MEYSAVAWSLLPLNAPATGLGVRMNADQVFTIREVAAILKLAEKTVYSMAHAGELPAFKVRGQWRIRRVDFEKWIAAQAKMAMPAKVIE